MRRALPLLLILAACQPSVPEQTQDFNATLQAHFDAIQARDLDAYVATITDDEDLTLIFPDGTLVPTRDGVVSFHESWFQDPDWQMSFTPVSTVRSDDMVIATVRASYRDTPDGEDRFNYLTLAFRVEDGTWRLVHDQNTRIANP